MKLIAVIGQYHFNLISLPPVLVARELIDKLIKDKWV